MVRFFVESGGGFGLPVSEFVAFYPDMGSDPVKVNIEIGGFCQVEVFVDSGGEVVVAIRVL